ncbi:diguanylate cyclase [Croceicoccus sp. Ery15]|uniref:sensor domain-containing diguanylate cyclase n=1 Tax=Croceicoccus sp. Ery15 TaxID=1703338 RepID=UPI001E4A8ADB|nr:diguanylate cyclase [Croceicoccus sp. Ery15]
MLGAAGAQAQGLSPDDIRPSCHAAGGIDPTEFTGGAQLAEIPWDCGDQSFGAAGSRGWLFFSASDLKTADGATHFVTSIARFDRLTLIELSGHRIARRQTYAMEDIATFVNGTNFAIPLSAAADPSTGEQATSILVAFDGPASRALLAAGVLEKSTGGPTTLGWTEQTMTVLAILVGLLIAPVIYNYAFYLVLRERFILWHIAMVLGMNAYLVVSSGIIHRFVNPGAEALVMMNHMSFLCTVTAGAAFSVNFIEPYAMTRKMRDIIMATGVATLIFGTWASLPLDMMKPFGNRLYLVGFLPILAVFIIGMVHAARRRSRAVWFQIYGWTPIMIVGAERIVRSFGVYPVPDWLDQIIFLTLGFEVIMATLGVVDRFDVLRRDRDKAEARIDSLASLVDRDALTGLFNRRALEARYPDLRADGYTALAVIDLDNFKRVNDRYGHAMGDRVLQETAAALSADPDTISFRLGGEEFLMLMRGADVVERAERMRRAISIRIVNEIDGIDAPITASLGLVDTTPGVATTLRRVYAHADRLLYEAKNSGRNRMLSERIQLFDAPVRRRRGDRRAGERRSAGAES